MNRTGWVYVAAALFAHPDLARSPAGVLDIERQYLLRTREQFGL